MKPIYWLFAAGAAAVAYLALGKKKKAMPGSPSTPTPSGPSVDSCDAAYSSLPDEWADAIDAATANATALGSPEPMLVLANTIEAGGTGLDPSTSKTIAACLRKNSKALATPMTPDPTGPLPGVVTPAPGFTPSFDPGMFEPLGTYSPFAPSGGGPLPAPPTPVTEQWQAVKQLPEPYLSRAMIQLSQLDYWEAREGRVVCGSFCPYKDVLRKIREDVLSDPTLAYMGSPADAAAAEILMAMNVLYANGY